MPKNMTQKLINSHLIEGRMEPGEEIAIKEGYQIKIVNGTKKRTISTTHAMSSRQVEMVLKGSLINVMKEK